MVTIVHKEHKYVKYFIAASLWSVSMGQDFAVINISGQHIYLISLVNSKILRVFTLPECSLI